MTIFVSFFGLLLPVGIFGSWLAIKFIQDSKDPKSMLPSRIKAFLYITITPLCMLFAAPTLILFSMPALISLALGGALRIQ